VVNAELLRPVMSNTPRSRPRPCRNFIGHSCGSRTRNAR
jgi:hypothetical protein